MYYLHLHGQYHHDGEHAASFGQCAEFQDHVDEATRHRLLVERVQHAEQGSGISFPNADHAIVGNVHEGYVITDSYIDGAGHACTQITRLFVDSERCEPNKVHEGDANLRQLIGS